MPFTRRSILAVAPGVGALIAASSLVPGFARAADTKSEGERAIGSPDAKIQVLEFFSLTCTHCAAFANTTFPKVKAELIDTGKIRFVYHDFPLDQLALTAAMVARTLPAERYEPFIRALFASQDRWAFNRQANPTEELWKTAALAGMSRATFDAAIADTALKNWIVAQQTADQTKYKIDSTPSFVINGKKASGAMSFEDFAKLVSEAA
jgi:protein-disulfide isomerase